MSRVEGKTEETFQAPVPDFGEKPGINPGLFSWLDDCQALPGKRKADRSSRLMASWPKTSTRRILC